MIHKQSTHPLQPRQLQSATFNDFGSGDVSFPLSDEILAIKEHLLRQLHTKTNAPVPHQGYQFHPFRHWQFDLAWPAWLLAIEFVTDAQPNEAPTQIAEPEQAYEKNNAAALIGWTVLYFTKEMVQDFRAITTVCKALGQLQSEANFQQGGFE